MSAHHLILHRLSSLQPRLEYKMHVDLENLKRRVRINEARIELLTQLGLLPDPMRQISEITDNIISEAMRDGATYETALS